MALKNKMFYLALATILVFVIHGSHESHELTGYFKANNIKNSNNVMIFSIDKLSYQQGQTINFTGKVFNFNQGGMVNIKIIDPSKNTVADFDSLLNSYGIFSSSFGIPTTFSNGKYILDASYKGDQKGKLLSLNVIISNVADGVSYVSIPYGAASQSNKINFDPSNVTMQQGAIISWKNKDVELHTIFSGKINDDGSLALDSHFKPLFLSPGNEVQMSLEPGKYSYFCKIHPWLNGVILVEKNPQIISKTTVKANNTAKTISKTIVKPFPVQNSVLQTIWKERKDLQKAYPEVGHGNLTKITKWATTTGWNQDKRLSALIPPGKVPSYLNDVLKSIWKERNDLQKAYPEVAKGNMVNMSKWATTTGRTQYNSLAILNPPEKISPKPSVTPKSPLVPNSVLQTIWKERKDLQKLYPEVVKGNFVNMTKWATTTGWNQDKRLSALIPPGKVPSYLNDVLKSIWKERSDLQKAYPEVAKGNLVNMTKWAKATGWSQYDSLSAFGPSVKTTK